MSSEKIKPCMSTTKRHSWELVKNKVVTTRTLTTAHVREVGIYKCRHCQMTKYGPPGSPSPATS